MDKKAFILANTQLKPVEALPELVLYQADEVHELWHMSEKQLQEKDIAPPFWAFAWAGGVGLSRFILDNPQFVNGKHIIDFASGSGLVAIAAIKAGAKSVIAIDIDPFSAYATQLNAKANDCELISKTEDIIGSNPECDLIIAGDIFYDKEFSHKVTSWFLMLAKRGKTIVVGDPARNYRPNGLHCLGEYKIPVSPILEEGKSKTVTIWKF